jgi:hypothetical protein
LPPSQILGSISQLKNDYDFGLSPDGSKLAILMSATFPSIRFQFQPRMTQRLISGACGTGSSMTPSPQVWRLPAANLAFPQSWNRYAYAMNNPLALTDPSGLDPCRGANIFPFSQDANGTGIFTQDDRAANGGIWDAVPSGSSGGGSLSLPPADTTVVVTADPIGGLWADPDLHGLLNDSSGGGGGGLLSRLKSAVCSALPSGRTTGASGGLGGIGSLGGGGEVVVNYNSGQVSAFGFGGLQVGWNGGASGPIYTGFVYGLNNSNSNYSKGFTGANGGYVLGGFAASSSGGLTGGASGLAPNGQVKTGGVSFGASLIPTPTGGVTATNYTKPLQLGKFWAFGPTDFALYVARQVCK